MLHLLHLLQLAGSNREPTGKAEKWFADFQPQHQKAEYRRERLEPKTINNLIVVTSICLVDQAKSLGVIVVSSFLLLISNPSVAHPESSASKMYFQSAPFFPSWTLPPPD